jgi:hypothetical protein
LFHAHSQLELNCVTLVYLYTFCCVNNFVGYALLFLNCAGIKMITVTLTPLPLLPHHDHRSKSISLYRHQAKRMPVDVCSVTRV